MKNILLFISISFVLNTFSQTTWITDPNFEQALINLGYDSGPVNGSVPEANINNITFLDVSNMNISSLYGINDFVSLTELHCNNNQLTYLLLASWMNLTYVDVSNNSSLTNIAITCYDLTYLDASHNVSLDTLQCVGTSITSLDLTQNAALTYLNCQHSNLTSLDLSDCIVLEFLNCEFNHNLVSLNVSQNTSLVILRAFQNDLTSLDVSQNVNLGYLDCGASRITSLDVTQNPALYRLNCGYNLLECLNVKNGNNNLLTDNFDATGNPNLTCVTVDNVAWSTANWFGIDAQTSFSADCGNPCTLDISELNTKTPKTLSKIIDLTGREIQYKKNTLMIYVYEDGTSERVIEFE